MQYILRAIGVFSKAIILTFMLAVILVAALSSLLRYYTPLVETYHESILSYINSNNDVFQLQAKSIRGDWQPLQPQLILEDVRVEIAGQDESILLDRVLLGIDLVQSLYYRSIYFETLEADGFSLVLKQSEAGLWGLRRTAVKASSAPPRSIKSVTDSLWNIENLVLRDLEITIEPYAMEKKRLPTVELEFVGSAAQKYLRATASDGKQEIAKIIMQSQGRPFEPGFAINAYGDFSQIDILQYLPFVGPQYGLQSAQVKGNFWLDYQQQKLSLDGTIDVKNFLFEHDEKKYALDKFSSAYALALDKTSIDLWLQDSFLVYEKKELLTNRIRFSKDDTSLRVYADKLNLTKVSALLSMLPLPEKAQQARKDLAISGEVQQLLVNVPLEQWQAMQISARLVDVSSKPYLHVPGIEHVSGEVFSSLQQGFVRLNTAPFSLYFPDLYHEKMTFDQASGLVSWDIREQRLFLSGVNLALDSKAMGNARGEFQLEAALVKPAPEPSRLSLSIGLKNSKAQYRNLFIPKTLNENLLHWLDTNILAADVLQGSYIFHGPLAADLGEMRVNQLWLDIDNGEISYLDAWPKVEAIKGELLLDNSEVVARTSQAKVHSVSLEATDISITEDGAGQLIDIQGRYQASSAEVLSLLKTPGLDGLLNHQLSDWQTNAGNFNGALRITVPISGSKKSLGVDVYAKFNNVALSNKVLDLPITRINGDLDFSLNTGLQSKDISLQLFKHPVSLSIASKVAGGKHQTDVSFFSKIDIKKLNANFKQPMLDFLQGKAEVAGKIHFSALDSYLQLKSDLQGLSIALPQPFKKPAAESQLLTVHMPLSAGEKILRINYGKALTALLRIQDQGLDAVVINLGVKKNEFKSHKILVGGQLLEADVESWLSTIEQYKQALKKYPAGESESPWNLHVDNIAVNRLYAYGRLLNNSQISIFDTAAYWQLSLDHQLVNAVLRIPDDTAKPYEANVQYLNLDVLSKSKTETSASLSPKLLSTMPDVDVVVSKLSQGEGDFGQWQFELRSNEKQVYLDNIIADVRALHIGPSHDKSARLSWDTQSEQARSYFRGQFSGKNIADALKAWGYSQEINSQSAEFNVNVNWPGAVTDYALSELSGGIDLRLGKGNFADADSSSTDALKLLGILNLSRIVRRLQLDFSDLTNKGLAYDKVSGMILFNQGVISLERPLIVDSPSSKISMQGTADTNTETLDINMGVTLPFASNLPWIVALAAGLPTAAGVYIVSKVLKKQVDKLSSAVYKVSGSFSEPSIQFIKVFDNE